MQWWDDVGQRDGGVAEGGPVAYMPLQGTDHRWSDPQAALVPPQGIDQEQGALLDDLGRRRVDVLRIRLGAAGQLRQMDRVGLLPDQERPDVAGGLAQIGSDLFGPSGAPAALARRGLAGEDRKSVG